MEEEKELPYYGICKTVILEAKMQALHLAENLNESDVNLNLAGKKEILADAKEIFDWFMEGMAE
jgi:hypothetical protein